MARSCLWSRLCGENVTKFVANPPGGYLPPGRPLVALRHTAQRIDGHAEQRSCLLFGTDALRAQPVWPAEQAPHAFLKQVAEVLDAARLN
jgi:hypothetical protein